MMRRYQLCWAPWPHAIVFQVLRRAAVTANSVPLSSRLPTLQVRTTSYTDGASEIVSLDVVEHTIADTQRTETCSHRPMLTL